MILLLLLSNMLFGSTQMSELVNHAQNDYASQVDKKIVIFDRDELGWRFSQAKAYDDEELQADIIVNYLDEKFGIQVDADNAKYFYAPYLTQMTGFAGAFPFEGVCAVFPPSANSNRRLGHERITGLTNKEQFEGLNFGKLRKRMSGEELLKISLYHELGHCLDDDLSMMASSYSVHVNESFAESVAIMLMSLEGHYVAKKRATHRAVYSWKMSSFFIENPAFGMGSETYEYGGQIYYLAPSIIEAEKRWKRNRPERIEDIIELAGQVVEDKVISGRGFQAIHLYFKNSDEDVVATYKEKASEWPEMFEAPYDELKRYLKEAKRYNRGAFGIFNIYSKGESLLPWDLKPFCKAYLSQNKQAFFELIDTYRNNLENVSEEEEGQINRANKLDSVYEIVSTNCVEAS